MSFSSGAGLLALIAVLNIPEAPPVFDGISLRTIPQEEKERLDEHTFDTEMTVHIKYPPPFRLSLYGSGESDAAIEIIDKGFIDQSDKPIPVKTGEWNALGDVRCNIWCDVALSSLPKSVKQLRLRMTVKVAGKWTLPISAVVYNKPHNFS